MAFEVARKHGTEDMTLLNHDIHPRVEDPDVKRFKREVAQALDLPITYANHPKWDQMDQFDVVVEAKAFKVKNGQELCTNRLKTVPFMGWLERNADRSNTVIYYGFDAGEMTRIQRRSSILGAQGWKTAYPLAVGTPSISSTREVGIEPPCTYGVFKHANCMGCLKAGWQHWYAVYVQRQDLWAKGKYAENTIGYTIHADAALEEREAQFAAMQAAGVVPTEHVPHQTFWAEARKKVRSLPVLAEETRPVIPCECVT